MNRSSSVVCVVQILGEPKQNRRLAAEITLQNPLPEPLQDCCFSIEGANLTGGRVISQRFAKSGLLFAQVMHESCLRSVWLRLGLMEGFLFATLRAACLGVICCL